MFRNPILGSNDTLVREAIQSEGYQPGVTGWRIERGGDAEFNDVTVRGRVEVGPDTGPQVIIDRGFIPETGYIAFPTNAPSEDDPAYLLSTAFNEGTPTEHTTIQLRSGTMSGAGAGVILGLQSQNNDGTSNPNAFLSDTAFGDIFTADRDEIVVWVNLAVLGVLSGLNFLIGTWTVSFSGLTSSIQNVTFPEPMNSAPQIVLPVISSGAGATANWTVRTDSYTVNGFRMLLSGPSATWSSVAVRYLAVYF